MQMSIIIIISAGLQKLKELKVSNLESILIGYYVILNYWHISSILLTHLRSDIKREDQNYDDLKYIIISLIIIF